MIVLGVTNVGSIPLHVKNEELRQTDQLQLTLISLDRSWFNLHPLHVRPQFGSKIYQAVKGYVYIVKLACSHALLTWKRYI